MFHNLFFYPHPDQGKGFAALVRPLHDARTSRQRRELRFGHGIAVRISRWGLHYGVGIRPGDGEEGPGRHRLGGFRLFSDRSLLLIQGRLHGGADLCGCVDALLCQSGVHQAKNEDEGAHI